MQRVILFIIIGIPMLLGACWMQQHVPTTAEKEALGSRLFFDKMLSEPDGQACSVCHAPRTAFADPDGAAVSEGMLDGAFVNRNSQSLMYVSFVPPLSKNVETGTYHGGLFWDGRSNDLLHQLSGPLFNPAEMNNADTAELVYEIKFANWRKDFNRIYNKPKTAEAQYRAMIDAIAHYEASAELRPFSSAYDLFLVGKYRMTPTEEMGYELFKGKAQCTNCHSIQPVDAAGHVLFTDYSYHNLGLPINPTNPFYTTFSTLNPNGRSAIDRGLGALVNDTNQDGKFRTPSLRNVEVTAPYFHHGGIATLEEAVHFIVARDQMQLVPEVASNIEKQHVGSLNITPSQEKAIVAFLMLLTDGYTNE
jgi:cytochrome c peroxidase